MLELAAGGTALLQYLGLLQAPGGDGTMHSGFWHALTDGIDPRPAPLPSASPPRTVMADEEGAELRKLYVATV